MRHTETLLAAAALIAAVPASATTQVPSKDFSIAADAIVYSSTCEAIGFDVDLDGVAAMALNVQQVAVWNGLTETQASQAMQTAIADEFERRGAEFQRASLMDHSLDHVERFERRWIKRCEKLAETPLTAPYFTKIG